MANEVFDGTDVVRQVFREGQRITDEAGDALPHSVIEALDMIRFAGVLRDSFVLRRRNDPGVDGILIRIKRRLLTVHRRQIGPHLFCTLVTAIADVERKDLPCLLLQGDPHPLLVRFFRHKTPHLISFHLHTSDNPLSRGRYRPHMQMIRQGRKASGHKTHEPSDTDTHSPANTMQRDFLAE